jgi:hypothetical protein
VKPDAQAEKKAAEDKAKAIADQVRKNQSRLHRDRP